MQWEMMHHNQTAPKPSRCQPTKKAPKNAYQEAIQTIHLKKLKPATTDNEMKQDQTNFKMKSSHLFQKIANEINLMKNGSLYKSLF